MRKPGEEGTKNKPPFFFILNDSVGEVKYLLLCGPVHGTLGHDIGPWELALESLALLLPDGGEMESLAWLPSAVLRPHSSQQ